MHRIPVRQIMQPRVITIRPDSPVADAAQMMEEHNIRRLPVVDEDDYLVGFLTDSDVREAETAYRAASAYNPDEAEWLAVGDVMASDVVTIAPDATLGELAALLVEHKVGGVPVVEPDPQYPIRLRLVGIVTETDIFRLIAEAWRAERSPQGSND
jgi:CBS domain-containing protein